MGSAREHRAHRESTISPKYETEVFQLSPFESSLRTLWALRETKAFSLARFARDAESTEKGKYLSKYKNNTGWSFIL